MAGLGLPFAMLRTAGQGQRGSNTAARNNAGPAGQRNNNNNQG
ncbi:uncharacterized protein AB675_11217, partial [Cyphellophora attinorum]